MFMAGLVNISLEVLEKDIENKFASYAAKLGCLCKRLKLEGVKGWPDRTIFCPGRHVFFIEFKRPSGSESEHQKVTRRILESLGFSVYVIDSVEEAKEILRSELRVIHA